MYMKIDEAGDTHIGPMAEGHCNKIMLQLQGIVRIRVKTTYYFVYSAFW
jgi:hypothetical protein